MPASQRDVSLLASPHDSAVAGAIEAALRAKDYHVMIRGAAGARDVRDSVQRWALDGVVLMGFTDDELRALDVASGVPTVVVDASFGEGSTFLHVRSDDFAGGRLAAEHLTALGHRRLVFCGPVRSKSRVVSDRLAGFRAGVAAAGLDQDAVELVDAWTTYEAGILIGAALAERPGPRPTGLFATADILAAGIMRGLADAAVAVPRELSVVGYDDAELALFVTPRLTTVAQDTRRKGQAAAQLLVSAIEGAPTPRSAGVDVALVVRESTAAAPS
jgi:LacI family transcriptional regulator